ncbi:MAG: hypothetical protein JSS00_11935 [Proteobacteria bacterium]|nr:hypothetical protein [Pseudomonadota bacterium]
MQDSMPTPAPDWRQYTTDAAWLPYAYDAREDTLVFAHLPRDVQRRAVFLDPRFLARAPKSDPAPLAALPAHDIRERAGKLHFIFHTGFCCSTLLTRALDIPGVSMGVKEPSVLVSFAQHFGTGRRSPGALSALGVTLDLLSRPLEPGETQIVKPSVTVNHAIPALLHLRPDAKALVLYSSLDAFIRAIARRGLDGREFARLVYKHCALAIPLDDAELTPEELVLQTDLQIAARVWLMQISFIAKVATHFGPARVRILNGDALLADRNAALDRLARFFRLPLNAAQIATIVDGPVFRQHSKHQGLAFDAAAHHAQHHEAGVRHLDELNAIRGWAHALARRIGAPLTLPDSLMDNETAPEPTH